ncbi:hypothetical protein IscW_ISCW000223 [Ixodes scapularis]|uniref:arginine kinase n=1 Tax=Ixodes scapularis TaxID=6945 RepID=B7P6K5_IXOSC|nr:hypothetical protein IscW_ISCW000223 [Ixodes scapularis]|eukprot:XP_002408999.1 hypothetical protein IscW_ISCW000223 [Ixodes scapularis]
MGASLVDIIQSGVENLDSDVCLCAPDAESYTLFAGLFNPVIEDYLGGFKATDKHPLTHFGDLSTSATYYPLAGMGKKTQQQLIDGHFLFKYGDRFLQAAIATVKTKRSLPPKGGNVWGTEKDENKEDRRPGDERARGAVGA